MLRMRAGSGVWGEKVTIPIAGYTTRSNGQGRIYNRVGICSLCPQAFWLPKTLSTTHDRRSKREWKSWAGWAHIPRGMRS